MSPPLTGCLLHAGFVSAGEVEGGGHHICLEVHQEEAHRGHQAAGTHLLREEYSPAG